MKARAIKSPDEGRQSIMWKIPLSDIDFDGREADAVCGVLRSGWLTMGEVTAKFERQFAEFIGVKHAIALSSCTAALHLANLAIGIGRGDEVICPSMTFVAGANSILYTGARPVFAEVTGPADLNISPLDIEKRITKRTRAIQVLHYAGFACDIDSIMAIARRHNLSVVEDCAHSSGAFCGKKRCGAVGSIGCFSFFSNKNMTTGEGGMVTTDDDELAKKIRLMRSHGMTSLTLDRHLGHAFSYDVTELGFNYRIDEMRSAIGMVQLEKLESNNIKRRRLAGLYRERLENVPGLELPFVDNGMSSHHLFTVLLDRNIDRAEFMDHMKRGGVQTSIHYPCVHLFDIYRRNFKYREGDLPVTEDVSAREVTLPLYPMMKEEDVRYVCDVLADFKNREERL